MNYRNDEYWQRLHQRQGKSSVGQSGLSDELNDWIYRSIARNLRRFAAKHGLSASGSGRTLEVGVGTGYWVGFWKNFGWQVDGCDLVPAAVQRVSAAHPDGHFWAVDVSSPEGIRSGAGGRCANQYALVTATSVLLHVTQDEAFTRALDNVAALVEPGGHLLLVEPALVTATWQSPHTPNAASRARLIESYLDPLWARGLDLVAIEATTVLATNPLEATSARRLAYYRSWWRFVKRSDAKRSRWLGPAMYLLDGLLMRTHEAPTSKFLLFRRGSGGASPEVARVLNSRKFPASDRVRVVGPPKTAQSGSSRRHGGPVMRVAKPHALYIVWGFPPSRGGGVYRALATANGLVDAGFDVTVLTCDRETFFRYTLADTSLEGLVRSEIEIVRIPFEWPMMDRDIRRWSRKRAKDPQGWRTGRIAEDQETFPEPTYGPWRGALVAAAQGIHRRKQVDLTVATANPNVDIEAAHQLFLRAHVPFVLDQRDAWTLNVFTEVETDDVRVCELEAEYFRDAHEVWFVNVPLRDRHAGRYPFAGDRIHTVQNGFDHDLAPAPRLTQPDPSLPLRFGYVGTISAAVPLDEFLQGWVRARGTSPAMAGATADLWGYLGFYAVRDAGPSAAIERCEGEGVRHRGPVSKTELKAKFDEFDVLLLIIGAGRFVTSGKVFEYMASGLPIVSVHHPAVDASRVLAGYPLWYPAESLDPDAIADALVRAAEGAREAGLEVRQACVEHAEKYDRRRQLAPRLESLHQFAVERKGMG